MMLALQVMMILIAIMFTPGSCSEYSFTNVGALRALPTSNETLRTLPAVNFGHCCVLCAATLSCVAVNYSPTSKSCTLIDSKNYTFAADSTTIYALKTNNANGSSPGNEMQAISGVLVQVGRKEGYTNYTRNNVPNVAYCWQLCLSLTNAKCPMFAFHSSLLTCIISDVDFYTTWTSTLVGDGNWTSYYLKKTSDTFNGIASDNYKLLYKLSKGIGVDPSAVLRSGPSHSMASSNEMAADATCACYLRNSIVDNFGKFPIRKIAVVVATAGTVNKYLIFSASPEDTILTFFTQSKIVWTSWPDLNSTVSVNKMLIGTSNGDNYGRYFTILRDATCGCDLDRGWLSINSPSGRSCTYDGYPAPVITYAGGSGYAFFNKNASYADALLIYAAM